jgi:hypothetical protein
LYSVTVLVVLYEMRGASPDWSTNKLMSGHRYELTGPSFSRRTARHGPGCASTIAVRPIIRTVPLMVMSVPGGCTLNW